MICQSKKRDFLIFTRSIKKRFQPGMFNHHNCRIPVITIRVEIIPHGAIMNAFRQSPVNIIIFRA